MGPDVTGDRRQGVTRVLVVDDHRLVRAGLRSLFRQTPDLDVVGEAADGAQAVALGTSLAPDVVVMDLCMPGMDGAEATRRLTASRRHLQVLVLTSYADGDRVRSALESGAVGYLVKDADPQDLIDGVRAVVRGESPLDARAVRAMLAQRRRPTGGRDLTDREREVLQCLVRRMTNAEIARALEISERTVKVHVGSIFHRIGVADRASAARWAEQHHASSSSVPRPSRQGSLAS